MGKNILLLVFMCFLCGCIFSSKTWKTDISDCKELNPYIGMDLKLQRDVGISKCRYDNYYYISYIDDELYQLKKKQNAKNLIDCTFGISSKGDSIIVESFVANKIYGGPTVVEAIGKIFIKESGDFEDFKYIWTDTLSLNRAPWDDDSVPKSRILSLDEDYKCK